MNLRWAQGSLVIFALGSFACNGDKPDPRAEPGGAAQPGAGSGGAPSVGAGGSSNGAAGGVAPSAGHAGHDSHGTDTASTGGSGGSAHEHEAADAGGSDDGDEHAHDDAAGSDDGAHDGETHSGGSGGSHTGGEHTGGMGAVAGMDASNTGGSGGDSHMHSGGTDAMGGANSTGGMGAMGGTDAMGGMGAMGGTDAMGGMGAAGGTDAMGGMGAMSGSGGMAAHDHCLDGEMADARDAQLATPPVPDHFTASNGDIDLPLPAAVLTWMDERLWKPSHDAWHNIRRCRGGTGGGEGSASSSATMCAHTELVPAHQECADADNGYEFLVMHRHMLIALRQAFPAHAELFAGFPHFPFDAKDVPAEWQSRFGSGWTSDVVKTAQKLEDIEHHLDEFPTEGDLGKYIQCGLKTSGASSIHGAMHFKWVVNESPNSLGKQAVNLGNYMFWKLHGWIDGIWERYRVARGQSADEQKLKDALVNQCREMHALGDVVGPGGGDDDTPLPEEHGFFHESVRPAFERVCVGCHSESSPEAGMSLAGHISSADIVKNLVNVQTFDGGQFKRIVPGHPEQSWLFLKASGTAADAGCVGDRCITQPMPPGATADRRLTAAELDTLEQWILDGAPAPTP